MEFENAYRSVFAIVGLLASAIHFFYIFKKPSLLMVGGGSGKSRQLSKVFFYLVNLCAWILIGIALAGPRMPIGRTKNKAEVNDIFFVVDVSRSMLAVDFKPNRLEAAKAKILEFVDLRPKDRIGIVMFSEKAFTLLPLSSDLELIRRITREINVGFLGSGTNIGDALGLAVGRGIQSPTKNKVIILLTDGVSNMGMITPIHAAEEAAKAGIKIYAIGVGGRKDAKLPVGGNLGFGQRYQRIPGGSIDMKVLEKIADMTDGKSFMAQNGKALSKVLEEINNLERTEIDQSSRVIYKEKFPDYMMVGGVLFLLSILGLRFVSREVE
jgi:Ca-activated chloride channel family protein